MLERSVKYKSSGAARDKSDGVFAKLVASILGSGVGSAFLFTDIDRRWYFRLQHSTV